jgi:hypothetical protein
MPHDTKEPTNALEGFLTIVLAPLLNIPLAVSRAANAWWITLWYLPLLNPDWHVSFHQVLAALVCGSLIQNLFTKIDTDNDKHTLSNTFRRVAAGFITPFILTAYALVLYFFTVYLFR